MKKGGFDGTGMARRIRRAASLCLAVWLVLAARTRGQQQPATPEHPPDQVARSAGRLIRIPLPITGTVPRIVRSAVQAAAEDLHRQQPDAAGPRPVLVFEFDPGRTEFGQGGEYTDATELADFLLESPELHGIRTVAYVPRSIKGHGVLVAMACEELVMAPDAEFGDAGIDEPPQIDIKQPVRAAYAFVADRRRTIPRAVALGMLDKTLQVHRVETLMSVHFVLEEDLDAFRETHDVQSEAVLIRRGEWGRFTGSEARQLGFAKFLANSRQQLADSLDLPRGALKEDPLLGRPLNARLVVLDDAIDSQVASRIQSMIDEELRSGDVNFLCLRIESSGGPAPDCVSLANFIADLDRSAVRTVAYVPDEARGGATLVALACDHLVMHPEAVLGGDNPYPLNADQTGSVRDSLRLLMASRDRNWSPALAFLDPSVELAKYTHRQSGRQSYFSPQELEEREDADQWQRREIISNADEVLQVTGAEAREMNLAWQVVENFEELKQAYGLQDDPRLVEPDWADYLIDALAHPAVAMFLLVIGGAALYAEIQMPGIGIGGFVASVAFLLFFWSKFLYGTAAWLEVLLFLAGVCFLLLEVFVLPGFGVFGLGGGLMVISSLVLASQTFVLPQTGPQLIELRNSMMMVAGAGLGILAATAVLRRYLPHTPMFNRLMLLPMQSGERENLGRRESVSERDELLGRRGTATTQLTPSGKATIDGTLLDVITDGEVVDCGSPVEVVEVRGNRVVVRPLRPS